ncbi:MAG: PIN domain-containing protein [Myxococcales bacterium]|nr:PIN domain-containing protein [Myxococcales bacterium]
MKRVLYDTNVLLDVLLRREPHFADSARALDAAGQRKVEGYLSGHSVATVAYVVQKQIGRAHGRTLLSQLLANLKVAAVTDRAVRQALATDFSDFEDALCHAAAEEAGAAVIVTRNVRDFRRGTIPAIDPAAFAWP